MAHTPGPWDIVPGINGNLIQGADRSRVVRGQGGIKFWDDARLVAAAPELLDALKALLVYPDRWCCCTTEQEAAGHTGECLQAQRAIAKAEGK